MKRSVLFVLTLCALSIGCGGGSTTTEATATTTPDATEAVATEAGGLQIGGTVANFGVHRLTTGFTPDPATVDVVSGGDIDASTVDTGGVACAGFVTGQPDVIVHFDEMAGFLRFAFRPGTDGADATLVINDGEGNWHCNDDGSGLNPVVDIANAVPGQYDIWIGSYNAQDQIQGQLLVTEVGDVLP